MAVLSGRASVEWVARQLQVHPARVQVWIDRARMANRRSATF
jgi:hypothetical protein